MPASDYGFTTPTGNDYISGGDDAITNNAQKAAEQFDKLLPRTSSAGDDADNYTATSVRLVWAFHNVAHTPDPAMSWRIQVTAASAGAITQDAQSIGLAQQRWQRYRGSTSWTAWVRVDAAAAIDSLATQMAELSPATSGAPLWRVLPLPLTAGGPPGTHGTTSGGLRHRFRVPAEVGRWRVHVRDINPRFGQPQSSTLAVSGVWIGPQGTTPGRWATAPTKVANGSSVAGGAEWVSPWITTPLTADTWHTLGIAWATSAAPQVTRTTAWTTAQADAGTHTAATAQTLAPPFDVWIEAEVPAAVPAVLVVGDSLSVGVGSTYGLGDSWPQQLAQTQRWWPIAAGHSGDGFTGWKAGTEYGWRRFAGTAKPDAVVLALGSNDVFGGASLATLQANASAVATLARQRWAAALYVASVLPREGVTGTAEDTRRAFNTWLSSLPLGGRDRLNIVPAVSTDDETLTDAYDSGDGIHLNTAGYAAIAASIGIARPLVPSAAAARAAIGAAADQDTGPRDITAAIAGLDPTNTGYVRVWRQGGTVHLAVYNLKFAATINGSKAFTLPEGFRPAWEVYGTGASYWGGQSGDDVRILGNGDVILQGLTAGEALHFNATYPCRDPWPATLPGTPA